MEEIDFTVPIKIDAKLSLNSVYGGMHWGIRKRQSDKIHKLVKTALLSNKIPKKEFEKPIEIVFSWNSKLDLDNHGYLAKLIIDGLKGYLIKDDTKKYIKTIKHKYWEGNGARVSIKEGE